MRLTGGYNDIRLFLAGEKRNTYLYRRVKMLNNSGFDLWAEGYDKSVGLSDEDGTYPFAGYRAILNAIYSRILSASAKTVLDIGFGTATLTSKLYERGLMIYGQDFSEKMLRIAREKMPEAELYLGDFAKGLAEPLKSQKYDAIIATYSLHHLTNMQKAVFIGELLERLNDGGCLYIGDVAFENREALEKCRQEAGSDWDEDEIYFVCEEIMEAFPGMQFEPMSHCAGLMTLKK